MTFSDVSTATVRYPEQLRRQLGFIERSCSAYDLGHLEEAVRIATAVRVLVHQTPRSTSLLTHLQADGTRLLSTSPPLREERGLRKIYYNGLASIRIRDGSAHLFAGLGNRSHSELLHWRAWWEQVVWLLADNRPVTRRDIVLAAANKDGGAHVDEKLTVEYEELARDGAAGFFTVQNGPVSSPQPFRHAHFVSLRQIGHEILASQELVALGAT